MKIRWQKIAPGVYQTDTGRWRISKHGHTWYVSDANALIPTGAFVADSLRKAKRLVDDQLDSEATNV